MNDNRCIFCGEIIPEGKTGLPGVRTESTQRQTEPRRDPPHPKATIKAIRSILCHTGRGREDGQGSSLPLAEAHD